jgi:hypothetical protein
MVVGGGQCGIARHNPKNISAVQDNLVVGIIIVFAKRLIKAVSRQGIWLYPLAKPVVLVVPEN